MFREKVKYKTSDGLEFWMDYQNSKAPYVAPTIRTADPEVSIVFVPTPMSYDEAFLMQYHGVSIVFSRPGCASRMHNDELEQLTNRNPGLDFVIKDIGHATKWTNTVLNHITEKVEHETYDLPSVCKFRDLEEQETMTTLFCELMAWATEGAIDMARGRCASDNIEWAKKRSLVSIKI